MSNTKRLLVYVVPVTVLSFALNVPKFMEVTLTQNNGTNEVDPSKTRRDPTFIFWYTLSLIWHPTLTTGVLPFIGLVYMNIKIFIGIRQSRQVSSSLYCSNGKNNTKVKSVFIKKKIAMSWFILSSLISWPE